MIANCPTDAEITAKVIDIIEEAIDNDGPLEPDVPMMANLGFDSLDMIETGFALQEFFEFEFSDKDALEELDKALGAGVVIAEGKLTPLGRELLLERMPELRKLDLPKELTPATLQQYYTIETFARLIAEFYRAAPETCPQTGEPVKVVDFKIVAGENNHPVPVPSGDTLIDNWVGLTAASRS